MYIRPYIRMPCIVPTDISRLDALQNIFSLVVNSKYIHRYNGVRFDTMAILGSYANYLKTNFSNDMYNILFKCTPKSSNCHKLLWLWENLLYLIYKC